MDSAALTMVVKAITLGGSPVRLEPLGLEQAPLLWDVDKNHGDETSRWLPYSLATPEIFTGRSRKLWPSYGAACPCRW
jgi:hypothetical protein